MTRANLMSGNFSDAAIERRNLNNAIHKRRVALVQCDLDAQRRAALVVFIGRYTVFGLVAGLAIAFFA